VLSQSTISLFSLFYATQFTHACNFRLFSFFFRLCLWFFFGLFCALGFFLQLQMGVVQLQLGAHFVTRDYGEVNGFLGGNGSF